MLLTKNGVAAPASHVLKLAVTRHKARLSAELTKARLRYGYATLDAFREVVSNGELEQQHDEAPKRRHPRWVRINTIKTTLQQQLSTTFAEFVKTEALDDVLYATSRSKIFFEDPNIPNLFAIPSTVDLSKTSAYSNGEIIFQDKASCFPAYLLDPDPSDGDVIDGTAAPGNKTTHLAAIISSRKLQSNDQKVIAFERDKGRTITLQKMVKLASADNLVDIKGNSDFLSMKPDSPEFAGVGAILLDPSCSGTGIVGRDDGLQMYLPKTQGGAIVFQKADRGKKRKRGDDADHVENSANVVRMDMDDATPEETPLEGKVTERLVALSGFQLRILTHAMQFPNVRKITYSTCSIHFEENEGVVFRALESRIAKEKGWEILKKEEQVDGLRKWQRRGVWEEDKIDSAVDEMARREVLDACIRCDKETEDGTMGFFVAGFTRREPVESQLLEDIIEDEMDEWNGFSDSEKSDRADGMVLKKPKKKKKKKKQKACID